MAHHFISYSYSNADAADFALKLVDALIVGPPPFLIWFDKRKLIPGRDWDAQIVESLRICDSLLFVMTHDSVSDTSVCKQEWTRALKYKKPVIPLCLHANAELPFRLEPRQYIDFSESFEIGLAKLRTHLGWLNSPEEQLQALVDRLADAERDLARADGEGDQRRIEQEMDDLRARIARQQAIVADPEAAAERTEKSIAAGIERERKPERPISGETRTKFINPPPMIAPGYFQDRYFETKAVGDFLRDPSTRMMTVVGRGGVGKTAMVGRLLRALERGRLPDDLGAMPVDGIVYLSEAGSHRISAPNLYGDLVKLLPPARAERFEALYKEAATPMADKMAALLEEFPRGRTVVLLDNLETVVDAETRDLSDGELDEALRALLAAPHHGVVVIATTRIAPRALRLFQPQRQRTLELDAGLASPYAEQALRALDADGSLGLRDASDALLSRARRRTRGYPRALEALYAILAADRSATLDELLASDATPLPENVVEALVGEAFSRLDRSARLVMQALAIYARPVTSVAVDHLLQPFLHGVDSGPVLNRLVNMHFVRRDEGRYHLHQVDLAYALSQIPTDDGNDDEGNTPAYTCRSLRKRGADYFVQTRLPRDRWRSLDDLEPQLAEFDLRCAGEDFDTAARVLRDIDFGCLLL